MTIPESCQGSEDGVDRFLRPSPKPIKPFPTARPTPSSQIPVRICCFFGFDLGLLPFSDFSARETTSTANDDVTLFIALDNFSLATYGEEGGFSLLWELISL